MRRLVAALAAVVLAAGLAGCGIPDYSPVREDGIGPERGYDPTGRGGKVPPARTDSTDVGQFTANFLHAAAGESSSAYLRVKDYIAPGSRGRLPERPGQEVVINLVRLTAAPDIKESPDGTSSVTVPVQQVGVLRPNGVVEPPVLTASEYTFKVGSLPEQDGLYVMEPPPVLLMNARALDDFYRRLTIYFWTRDRQSLVPDVRYMPLAVPHERWATEVRDWLIDGPAEWLADSVLPLPAGTQAIGNVTRTGSRLAVNLSVDFGSAGLASEPLRQLGTQLAWSLREAVPDAGLEVEILVRDQRRDVFDAAERRRINPVYTIASPQRYAVYGGTVYPLVTSDETDARPAPIGEELNRDVVSAALARDGRVFSAALVTADAGGHRLVLAAGADVADRRTQRSDPYREMKRPVWLKGSPPANPVGLVVADGRLYRFSLDTPMAKVDLRVSGQVTAVGASPDGRRIAFVAGGQLYVAGLILDGDSVSVGTPRRLPTSLRDLTAVDWSDEDTLVVAGVNADDRVALHDVTVDGAQDWLRFPTPGTAKVTHLSVYPTHPLQAGSAQVLYEANGVAWDEFARKRIDADAVGAFDGPRQPDQATPTAPFFVY